MIAVKKNLKDQILTDDNKVMFCPICQSEYSANAGDYWYVGDNYVFKCCDNQMILATKETTIKEA